MQQVAESKLVAGDDEMLVDSTVTTTGDTKSSQTTASSKESKADEERRLAYVRNVRVQLALFRMDVEIKKSVRVGNTVSIRIWVWMDANLRLIGESGANKEPSEEFILNLKMKKFTKDIKKNRN